MTADIEPWPKPAPWLNYIAQGVILDHREGKVTTCDHYPQPVSLLNIRDDTPPVIHDADDRIMRCLGCFTKTWALHKPHAAAARCVRCGTPGTVFRAPTVGYPNLLITVTACTDHGPGGQDW